MKDRKAGSSSRERSVDVELHGIKNLWLLAAIGAPGCLDYMWIGIARIIKDRHILNSPRML